MCDIGFTGRLNHEQFALAMHFVNKKLSTGLDPPVELLPEMVPPSLRPKPVLIEETIGSKEFEELQTQVTELQREKLFYEQRASEHETQTRQKRTELTNLELEMESIYKTIQERESNKIEENKKLADFEDKLAKLSTQLRDLKSKYEQETIEINQLRSNIVQMSQTQFKNQDLSEIRRNIQALQHDQTSLEQKKQYNLKILSDLNSDISNYQTQVDLNRSKITLLKKLESNLNKLKKEYDLCNSINEVSEEIIKLEAENGQLELELSKPSELEDPFKTQDPFSVKDTFSDPFNSTTADILDNPFPEDPFSAKENPDPFAQAFDPFKTESKPKISAAPPRPAPPRPQTPSLKPAKKPTDFTQRPQSAMDFTNSSLSAAKMDLFNNFDPFAPDTIKSDPFGANDWASFSAGTNGSKSKDPFDPFA